MNQQKPGGETRPAQAGETDTTRFGMEDGDNTEISTVGGPTEDDADSGEQGEQTEEQQ